MRLVALPLLILALLLVSAAFVFARPAATDVLAPRAEVPPGRIALDRSLRPAVGKGLAIVARRAARAKELNRRRAASRPGPEPPPPAQQLPVAVMPPAQAAPASPVTPSPVSPPPAPSPPLNPAEPPPPAPPPPPLVPEPPPPAPATPLPSPEPAPEPLLDAGFESGLDGWNTAGVGEVLPSLSDDIVRDGRLAAVVRLTGDLDRSELILGGTGGRSTAGTVRFYEGDEYWYAFSFYIHSMVYGRPGAHNTIMQFKSDGEGSPSFGLQLWDYEGDDGVSGGRGLWSHGAAMGGDRFLAPAAEGSWHDVIVHFKASRVGAGSYEVYLDGRLVDARDGVSMIRPDRTYAYIKDGLYRNGSEIPGTSEIRLDAARLGTTKESVLG
ncbi:MAG TPA: heparin lyase I family protein [Solirubrobacterales bacterium]|nr:heparin lyase I family protein [Solirubrobacterales bacterium]